jgi:AAHS family benzoate transporter-like MFS transporter
VSKKQLLVLYLSSLALWTIGNGIAPLLPIQAVGLGASQAVAGYCLALSQMAMAAGTVSAGWLSDRFGRRKRLVIVAALVSIPALYLMGQAATLWHWAAVLTVLFFCAGLILALASITAGLCAKEGERGKIFGLLAVAPELGALLGGLLGGPIADRYGFAAMYAVLAGVGMLVPLVALIWEEPEATLAEGRRKTSAAKRAGLGQSFYLLFLASLGAAVASFVFFLGRSFAMTEQGFTSAAVSSTGAIGGLIVLPLPLLVGWLSDRLGRKRFVALSFLGATAGLLVLCVSTSLWHFWVASMMFTLSFVGGPVSSAFVTDLVPQESLSKGLSLYGTTTWLGGIAGCAITGCATQWLGLAPILLAGACLPFLSVGLLAAVGGSRGTETVSASVPGRGSPAATPTPA